MKRIISFGCSLTQYHNWRYLIKDAPKGPLNGKSNVMYINQRSKKWGYDEWVQDGINLIDYSIAGGGNDLQHIQYANAEYTGTILKDDIILWQISSPGRIAGIDENEKCETIKNIFTDDDMRLCNYFTAMTNPYYNEYLIRQEYFPQTTTYNTVWQLNGVKRNNNKLLVIFGWDSCFKNEEKYRIIEFFKKHGIDYIEESILQWSERHNFHNENKDDIHPPQEGFKSFTEGCLLPKLKELKWL